METPDRDVLRPQVRTQQIIVGAMILGVVTFAIVTVAVNGVPPLNAPGGPLSTLGLVAGLFALVGQSIVARMMREKGRAKVVGMKPREEQVRTLQAHHTSATIVACALLEGAAFLNLVVNFMEEAPWSYAMAALMTFAMASKIPSLNRSEDWVTRQLRQADEQAALAVTRGN